MKHLLACASVVFVMTSVITVGGAQDRSTTGGRLKAVPTPEFLTQYCVTCHNGRLKTGGLALDSLDIAQPGSHADVWEKVVRKLRTGMMPPEGANKPADAVRESFTASLEAALDRAAAERNDPGMPALHRLNRAEYANVIRDLLDLNVDVATMLPPDDAAAGFDNIADVLGVSPALIEGYAAAASKISRLAVGDAAIGFDRVTYAVPGDLSQDVHFEGLPLGTRGGIVVRHTFPLDAEYDLQVNQGVVAQLGVARGAGPRVDDLDVTLDGERVTLQGRGPTRMRITAGPHTIAAAVIVRSHAGQADGVYHVEARTPGVSQVVIAGPYNASGPGDTPSRRRIFTCTPTPGSPKLGTSEGGSAAGELPCATKILSSLASRAWRHPVSASNPEVETLLGFYRDGRKSGSFDLGIERALARVLVDPQFLFRFEREPANLAPGRAFRISDLELASRLSFFLWSSIPDEELMAAATKRTLSDPVVLERQVRRMLKDLRSQALVSNFAGQWLALRELGNARPDSPDFDGNLKQAFQQETELLFKTIMDEDRSILDLLDTDFTFVNGRLAKHYGIPNVHGSRMRRIALPPDNTRRGLLGQGSILTVTSAANRTSPVTRGKWILETLLGAPPPNPPPGVETNLEKDPEQVKVTSLRQRLELHRRSPQCASCHRLMDPIGFSLENFDHTGKWRSQDGPVTIDASGQLLDGTRLDGPVSLRRALLARSDLFAAVAAEKMLTYAVGRAMRPEDMPAVRAVTRAAAQDRYRFSSLVLNVVKTPQFQMRTKAVQE